MKLNLEKDIVIFDIESTGLSIAKDRIVQLAIIKIFADGTETLERCRLINPEMPIPPETTEIHGITDEDVANEPTFKQMAKGLSELIGDADLAGFNSNRFDVPMLMEEFNRAGVEFDMTNRRSIDAWRIFQKMEPRNLKAAYKYYCGKDLEGAHDALNDTRATVEVLMGQLDKYEGMTYDDDKGDVQENAVRNDMQALHEFTNFNERIDFEGKFVYDEDGIPVFNFGKYQNKSITDVLKTNPGYEKWFMGQEFSTDTKNTLKKLMEEERNRVAESVQEQS